MTIMKRMSKLLFMLIAAFIISALLSQLLFGLIFKPPAPQILSFDEVYQKEALITSTKHLFEVILNTHPGITIEKSALLDEYQFNLLSDAEFAGLRHSIDLVITKELTGREYLKQILPLISSLNDEHTEIDFFIPDSYPQISLVKKFPYQLNLINGIIFLDEDIEIDDKVIPKGSVISAINEVDSASLVSRLTNYFSGFDQKQKHNYLRQYYREALYIEFGENDAFEITIDGITYDTMPTIQEPRSELAYHYQIANDTLYFELKKFSDTDDFKFFLENMFAEAQAQNIQKLVINLSDSRGGASAAGDAVLFYLTEHEFTQLSESRIKISEEAKTYFITFIPSCLRFTLMQYYIAPFRKIYTGETGAFADIYFSRISKKEPQRFTGEIEVLTNAGTMSSASLFSATVRQYGIGTVIGEPGAPATHFGNQIDYYTENGLKVSLPTSYNIGN